ncbi:PhnD/SsuA/transferrin family substrate-binding protein, partial [Corallococcus sp. CA041A]|uniref:PhnD/SsuA/transferrin family substrate-binding protein n=1 Tax=Corallococcus sp. CA041A TaxID=2316727 RepID=UPI001F24C7AB
EMHAVAAAFSLVGDDARAVGYWKQAWGESQDRTVMHEYQGALEAVLEGRAQVTSVFCPPSSTGLTFTTGVEDVLGPGMGAKFELLAYTDEAPNDGVPVAMGLPAPLVTALETALLGLQSTPDGQALLRDIFNADRFEVAPRMGYRALYRVALASL